MAGREGCKFFSRGLKNLVIRYWLLASGYWHLEFGTQSVLQYASSKKPAASDQ
jgi:hypothetical protein